MHKDTLPPRVIVVWEKLAGGLANPGIGDYMSINTKSVENYITILYRYLGLQTTDHRHRRVTAAKMWTYGNSVGTYGSSAQPINGYY